MTTSNLSFGTMKVITQGCEPIQQKVIEKVVDHYKSNPGIMTIRESHKTGDIFFTVIPKTRNDCRHKNSALKEEQKFADNVSALTGLKTEIDTDKEDKHGILNYFNKPVNLEKGLEKLKQMGVNNVFMILRNVTRITPKYNPTISESTEKKKIIQLTNRIKKKKTE